MLKKLFFILLTLSTIFLCQNSFATNTGDITKTDFKVPVGILTPGNEDNLSGKTTTEVINMTLGNIIQKLMIGLGSFALLIMTVGGGYMVIYHGQDELLSKGKSMFIGGITGLVVALSSYYIIDLIRFILYK